MADAQRGDDFPEEDDDGGGESTVSMASPTLDPAMPLPISVPPPPMPATGQPAGVPSLSVPTAPTPFTPQPLPASGQGPVGHKPPSFGQPAGGAPPAANAAKPQREPVMSGQATGAAGVPAGMKRPQTVIGLAPPPVGAPRPGQAGARGVPLPSGKAPQPAAPRPAAGAPAAAAAPASEKHPPSSGRGVKPPSSPKAIGSSPKNNDADATDEQLALPDNPRDSIPDSQKEDMATMAKSPEESLALFGLDSGLTDAARAAVVPKPGPAAGTPPANRSPLASTNLAQSSKPLAPISRPGGGPPPLPPSSQPQVQVAVPATPENALPVLHDRSEEEESTRAVSREEMLRGHDAVIIGEDSEGAQGEDATLALAPGFNEANLKNFAALAETVTKEQASQGLMPAAAPPQAPFDQGQHAPQPPPQGYPQQAPQQGWQPQPQAGWQDPNAPQGWQDPNAYQHQGAPQGHQSYPGMSVGPVSGPHLPAQSWTPNAPPSQPHFPGAAQMPQSQPQLQVPQSGHMMAQGQQGAPIPYPGQPNFHQPPTGMGDWNANAQPTAKKPFKLSGQILLLAAVGAVCLAIFITGIVLFATTKF